MCVCVTVVADLDDGLKWLLVGDRFLMIFARHLYDTLRNVDVHVFHSVGTGWNRWNNDFLVILNSLDIFGIQNKPTRERKEGSGSDMINAFHH